MKYGYEWADRKATGKIQNLVRCTRCIDLLSLCCFLLIRLSRQLYANDLSSLPEGIFDPLISLNTLYVSRNYMLWQSMLYWAEVVDKEINHKTYIEGLQGMKWDQAVDSATYCREPIRPLEYGGECG